MARPRKINKRKYRMWTEVSATTFSTQPSGVTIDSDYIDITDLVSGITTGAGLVSKTEVSYLDGVAGDVIAVPSSPGISWTGASVAWGGVTLQIDHGFTDLYSITAQFANNNPPMDTTNAVCLLIRGGTGDTLGTVSGVVIQHYDTMGGTTLAPSGGTIFWMAFGK